MKKNNFLEISFLIVMILNVYIPLVNYENIKRPYIVSYESNIIEVLAKEADEDKIVSKSIDDIVLSHNNTSESYLNKIKENYNKLPNNYKKEFEENNWVILITNENLKEKFNLKYQAVAVTEYPKRTIYINSYTKANTIFHEFGHFIDYNLNFINKSAEFKNIYKIEKNKFIKYTKSSKSNTNTTQEYFAESYEEFMVNPDKLKKYCPLTYNFLNNINEKSKI